MNTPQVRSHLSPLKMMVSGLALAATFGLAGCGGGESGGYTPSAVSQTAERRAFPAALANRASVNYSPYRTARNESELGSEVITPANVLQDLRLVQATGIGNIRLFSCRAFARTVLEVIRDNGLDLKVQLGTYPNPVTGPAAEADNLAELDAGIAHQLYPAFHDILFKLHVWNTVHQQATEPISAFIDSDAMSGGIQLLSRRKATGAGADNRNLFPGSCRCVVRAV